MFIPIIKKTIRENPIGEEIRVRYDIDNVWNEFVYKENKVLLFIDKYLIKMKEGLKLCGDLTHNNSFVKTNDILEEATYYLKLSTKSRH